MKRLNMLLLTFMLILGNVTPVYSQDTFNNESADETINIDEQQDTTDIENETEINVTKEDNQDVQQDSTTEEVINEEIQTPDQKTESKNEELTEDANEAIVEKAMPIFNESKRVDDVVISVSAEEGVFPEGSKLSVEKVVYYVQKQVDNVLDEVRNEEANVVASYTFDIKILDSEGNEIQPKDDSKVKVSFTLAEATNENLDTNVYHIDDKQEEITSDNVQALDVVTEGEEVVVETNGFSIYTVEFTYNNKEYVLDGDDYIKLYDLLSYIGLNGEVSSWEVSNPSLFNIFKGTEDEVSYDYEIIDEYIYETPINNPDGDVLYVVPLQMFDTEEWLKVTIDGIEYEIKVTDDNIYQTVPSSYSGNISTHNDDNVAITGDTYFLNAPKPDYVMQSQSTTSATDFAAGLPLSTIFIDVDKIGNANNIGVQGEFTLLTENEAIRNGFEHYYTTDGSGANVNQQLTGDVVMYNPLADTENLMQIEPNKINVLEGDLFQFIYRDAAILPNGNRAHVKMVYSNAKIAVDQRLGVTHTASGLTTSNYQGAIYLARGGTVARGGTDERYLGWRSRTTAQEPNQPFTQAQKQAMVDALDSTLSTNWGQSYTTSSMNSAETPALGQSIDVKYQVVDDDGNPIDGTFIFAVTGVNLDRDPYAVSGNNTAKPLWTYTKDDSETHFFSEAMSINHGKVSDYIYVRPNTNVFESDALKREAEASNPPSQKLSYYYAQVIEDANGHVKFIGNGYNPSNLGGNDKSYNAGFVVLANAKDGITITSTGHATSRLGMNTQAWGGVQIWYRYTSSTGPNGNIQTTSEGNYGGTLDDTSDHGVSSNILDPNTFVVPEGKTVTYTLTPDENYQIAKLQVANANGTMREIKYNGNKPLSSMQEGATYRFNDAAGRQCILTALADGKFTLEVPYATHDEKFHVEWRRNNASVKIKKDTVDNKEGTFTFKIKAYKKSDVTTYSPILLGSIWKNSETGNYETSFIDGVTVNLTPDEIATILADATIDTKHFITGAEYTWGSYLAQTNINLSNIGVTYGEDDTLFVGFENLPTSLIGDNVGYALNTGYSAAGPERIYLYHPSTNIKKDVLTYWNFNSLKGQSSNPGWHTFTVNAGEEEELTVEEGYTYEVQEVNNANWQLLDIDGNPIQTATGNLTADNRNPSHDFLNREVPDLTIKKETLNNAPGTFSFTANIYKEEEILGINHEVTIQAVLNNGEVSYTLNNAGEELEIPGVAIIPNGEYIFESGDDDLDGLMSIMLYSVKHEVSHNIEVGEENYEVSSEVDRALGIQVEEMINDGYTSASFEPVTYTFKTETKIIRIPYNPQSLPIGAQCNDGVCTFTLNNEQSITFENVPYGSKYEIVESPQDGWRLTSKINDSGTLTENTTAKFTNEELLSLTIRKETDEDTGEEFNFEIKVWGNENETENEYLNRTEAYAVFDSSDNSLTFFRDEKNKYVNGQTSDTKTYYTGVENTGITSSSVPWSSICVEVTSVYFIDRIKPEQTAYWFNKMGNLTSITGLEHLDVSQVTSMQRMFSQDTNLTNLDLSHFDTSNVTDMSRMFSDCHNLVNLNISSINTSNLINANKMFNDTNNISNATLNILNMPTDYGYMLDTGGHIVVTYGNSVTSADIDTIISTSHAGLRVLNGGESMFTEPLPLAKIDISKLESTEKYFVGMTNVLKMTPKTDANNDGIADDGIYAFTLTNNESITIPNIPYGYNYEIYEVDVEGNRVAVGDIFNIKWQLKSATNTSGTLEESITSLFTNEIKRGSIKVNKETKGNEDGEFTFRVKVWKDATDYLDLSSQGGTTTSKEGVYEFTISNGENFSIENIPFGYKYEVYEETTEGWDLVSIDRLTPREKAEGTIESEEPYEHTFLNAKRHKLVFEKKVSGNMGDKYKEFEFEVKVYGNKTLFMDEIFDYRNSWDSDTLVGGVLFKNPEINQPLFVDYFESKVNQKTYAYGITDNGVMCYEGDTINDEGSNTYLPSIPHHLSLNNGDIFHYELSGYGMGGIGSHCGDDEYPIAYLNLENAKHGGAIAIDYLDLSEYGAIESDAFTSSVAFTIPGYTSITGGSQYHEPEHEENIAVKTYTFKLKHGDKIEIEVPYGYEYEIVEKDYSDEGYKQSVDGKEGREISGELTEDKNHLFENRNQVAVPTEIKENWWYGLIIIIPIIWFIYNSKNKKKEIKE